MGKVKNIIIIGKNSYLAKGFTDYLSKYQVYSFSHTEWKKNSEILKNADVVINFAIHPYFNCRLFNEKEILDLEIAKNLPSDCHYIFLSSRRVYKKSNKCHIYTEQSPVLGEDYYSKNKLFCEKKLTQTLKTHVTILRISNIIGEKTSKKNYHTFMGWISQKNKQEILYCDWNSHTIKDFITKDFFYKCLCKIIELKPSGIFNLSAGFGITIQKLMTQLFNKKQVVFCDKIPPQDQFILDNHKLTEILDVKFTYADLLLGIKKLFNK